MLHCCTISSVLLLTAVFWLVLNKREEIPFQDSTSLADLADSLKQCVYYQGLDEECRGMQWKQKARGRGRKKGE